LPARMAWANTAACSAPPPSGSMSAMVAWPPSRCSGGRPAGPPGRRRHGYGALRPPRPRPVWVSRCNFSVRPTHPDGIPCSVAARCILRAEYTGRRWPTHWGANVGRPVRNDRRDAPEPSRFRRQ
jgi:hypothetical protein